MHDKSKARKTLLCLTVAATALVCAGVSPICAKDAKPKEANGKADKKGSVGEVTDASFKQDVLKADKLVLVDFWAPWCGPCRMQGPIIEDVSKQFGDKIKVFKLNTDENQKTAQAYSIDAIPALFIFKGGKIVEQKKGLTQKEELINSIKKYL